MPFEFIEWTDDDTVKLDADIVEAENNLTADPNNEGLKKQLADLKLLRDRLTNYELNQAAAQKAYAAEQAQKAQVAVVQPQPAQLVALPVLAQPPPHPSPNIYAALAPPPSGGYRRRKSKRKTRSKKHRKSTRCRRAYK